MFDAEAGEVRTRSRRVATFVAAIPLHLVYTGVEPRVHQRAHPLALDVVDSCVDKGGTAEIKAEVDRILNTEKESLRELSAARISGEIDDDIFKQEIEREKKVVEAELLTIEIMTKALAQKAINEAMDIFAKAIAAAI